MQIQATHRTMKTIGLNESESSESKHAGLQSCVARAVHGAFLTRTNFMTPVKRTFFDVSMRHTILGDAFKVAYITLQRSPPNVQLPSISINKKHQGPAENSEAAT